MCYGDILCYENILCYEDKFYNQKSISLHRFIIQKRKQQNCTTIFPLCQLSIFSPKILLFIVVYNSLKEKKNEVNFPSQKHHLLYQLYKEFKVLFFVWLSKTYCTQIILNQVSKKIDFYSMHILFQLLLLS